MACRRRQPPPPPPSSSAVPMAPHGPINGRKQEFRQLTGEQRDDKIHMGIQGTTPLPPAKKRPETRKPPRACATKMDTESGSPCTELRVSAA